MKFACGFHHNDLYSDCVLDQCEMKDRSERRRERKHNAKCSKPVTFYRIILFRMRLLLFGVYLQHISRSRNVSLSAHAIYHRKSDLVCMYWWFHLNYFPDN